MEGENENKPNNVEEKISHDIHDPGRVAEVKRILKEAGITEEFLEDGEDVPSPSEKKVGNGHCVVS